MTGALPTDIVVTVTIRTESQHSAIRTEYRHRVVRFVKGYRPGNTADGLHNPNVAKVAKRYESAIRRNIGRMRKTNWFLGRDGREY